MKLPPESEKLEYKEQITSSFPKTVSAFANYDGGTIRFGIADDRTITGLNHLPENADRISSKINDTIQPVPPYRIEMDEETGIIDLHVLPGRQKPYLYKGKPFRRTGASTIEADRYQFQELILQGRNMTYDALPAEKQNLQFKALEKEAKEKIGIEKLGADVLRTLGLRNAEEYNRAAELLADQNPYSGTDCVVFGSSINVIRQRETFNGISVLEQFEKAVSLFRSQYIEQHIEGMTRKTVERIPEAAFREALVNALIHRNWSVPASILVRMYPDRVEVLSPRGLPDNVKEQDYLEDLISLPRNPVLAYVFLRLGYIERLGTGIMRIKEAYAASSEKPAFRISENTIGITLPLIEGQKLLTYAEKLFLDQMEANILYSRKELEQKTGLNKSNSARRLRALLEKGYIETSGQGRSTRYIKRSELEEQAAVS